MPSLLGSRAYPTLKNLFHDCYILLINTLRLVQELMTNIPKILQW